MPPQERTAAAQEPIAQYQTLLLIKAIAMITLPTVRISLSILNTSTTQPWNYVYW
jgi:hypothetical protein